MVTAWVILFWRLGYSTFWDPDEAHYAQSTREMLAAHEWLAPIYNGQPFFDKPVLFHTLQMASFSALGPTEFAARLVPALSAVALLLVIFWIGRELFGATAARIAALMFVVLPATFALTRYAILDMTFTLLLLIAAGCVIIAAVRGRPRLQWAGYIALGLAVLTKGPLALVLTGLAFLLTLAITPSLRRPLLALQWGRGLIIAVAIAAPWFIYMWVRFGDAFIAGYALRENIWLYARPLYGNQPSYFFYARTMAVALLPWTALVIGRLVDVFFRGERMDEGERALWAWTLAILAFFSVSRFKLDHYIFPAAPALCLLAARAWVQAQQEPRLTGVQVGRRAVGLIFMTAGTALVLVLQRVPVMFSGWILALPVALIGGGLLTIVEMILTRRRGPRVPISPFATLVVAYAVLVVVALPAFEEAKPVGRLARLVAMRAGERDQIAAFRLNRWNGSWRYYVERQTRMIERHEDLQAFFAQPGTHYCAMPRAEFEVLRRAGLPVRIVYEQEGLFTTTGRNLRAGRNARRERFVVVTDAEPDMRAVRPPTI
jgi:4-amino-4-deoxy-L-arabinose transferase-like glycosyltransferase